MPSTDQETKAKGTAHRQPAGAGLPVGAWTPWVALVPAIFVTVAFAVSAHSRTASILACLLVLFFLALALHLGTAVGRMRRRLDEVNVTGERRYRTLVENSPGMISIHDVDGTLLSVNPASARLLGFTGEEIEGTNLRRFVDPQLHGRADDYLDELRRTGESAGLMRVKTRAGEERIILFRSTAIEEADGRRIALSFGQDVTELKQAERELRTNFDALRDLNRIATAPGLDFRDRINALLDLGRERFSIDAGAFCRLRGGQAEVVAARPNGRPLLPGQRLDVAGNFAEALAERPLFVERAATGEPPDLRLGDTVAGALFSMPVHTGGRSAGSLLFLDRRARERTFDVFEIEFLKLMALWVGAQLEQEQRALDAGRLAEMSELLQSCGSLDEAHGVVAKLAAQFFHGCGGALLLGRRGEEHLSVVGTWGEPDGERAGEVFVPADCWAARRGREHWVEDATTGLLCRHLANPPPASFLCVPMIAMGDLVGVLHLWPHREGIRLTRADRRLAASVAEHAALALANLELREDLRQQSIHDSLTGLANRRHFDRRLDEECRRAARSGEPLSLLLIDVDTFKGFNDAYGHQAGDLCLGQVADALRQRLRRSGDLLARYGGEEFAAILPATDAARAAYLGEEIRADVEALAIPNQASAHSVITVSLGAATTDHQGEAPIEPRSLVASADRALYEAKAAGRNQVACAAVV
jgi:diguanylate cyclase (GGDEF)-like protein/PAS domain S-box-containing protein